MNICQWKVLHTCLPTIRYYVRTYPLGPLLLVWFNLPSVDIFSGLLLSWQPAREVLNFIGLALLMWVQATLSSGGSWRKPAFDSPWLEADPTPYRSSPPVSSWTSRLFARYFGGQKDRCRASLGDSGPGYEDAFLGGWSGWSMLGAASVGGYARSTVYCQILTNIG